MSGCHQSARATWGKGIASPACCSRTSHWVGGWHVLPSSSESILQIQGWDSTRDSREDGLPQDPANGLPFPLGGGSWNHYRTLGMALPVQTDRCRVKTPELVALSGGDLHPIGINAPQPLLQLRGAIGMRQELLKLDPFAPRFLGGHDSIRE